MSNIAHFSQEQIARFQKPQTRVVRKRPVRRYYLIICEGRETETNYFKSLRQILPPDIVRCIEISGTGANTLSLLACAEAEYKKREKSKDPSYDKIWLVFDKDSFPDDNFDNTISAAKSRTKPGKCVWDCAWSNEAFELWFLLHFNNHSVALSRTQFEGKLEAAMKKSLGIDRKYEKTAKDMYSLLEHLQKRAIANAKEMYAKQKEEHNEIFSKMNPSTTVHLLVEELISYIQSAPKNSKSGTRKKVK
ncbi:MAG: RloB family protein [Victivallaceae bacterium]